MAPAIKETRSKMTTVPQILVFKYKFFQGHLSFGFPTTLSKKTYVVKEWKTGKKIAFLADVYVKIVFLENEVLLKNRNKILFDGCCGSYKK